MEQAMSIASSAGNRANLNLVVGNLPCIPATPQSAGASGRRFLLQQNRARRAPGPSAGVADPLPVREPPRNHLPAQSANDCTPPSRFSPALVLIAKRGPLPRPFRSERSVSFLRESGVRRPAVGYAAALHRRVPCAAEKSASAARAQPVQRREYHDRASRA